MDVAEVKDWSALLVPWAGMFATAFVALKVGKVSTKVTGVHTLVDGRMTEFKAEMEALLESKLAMAFSDGQQDIRDANRAVVRDAARATTAAGNATVAAADATTAAVTLTGLTASPPALP